MGLSDLLTSLLHGYRQEDGLRRRDKVIGLASRLYEQGPDAEVFEKGNKDTGSGT